MRRFLACGMTLEAHESTGVALPLYRRVHSPVTLGIPVRGEGRETLPATPSVMVPM